MLHVINYRLKAQKVAKKLDALKVRHQQCLNTLHTVAGMMSVIDEKRSAKKSRKKEIEKDMKCLEQWEWEALADLEACGPAAQAILEAQINAFTSLARDIESI